MAAWKTFLQKLSTECTFHRPVSTGQIEQAEYSLGIALPQELRELLQESDGVDGEYDSGLIWPAGRIVEDNLAFRQNPDFKGLYMPFDPLLFFADAGNGDQFAFVILNGEVRSQNIFLWNHEDDSRTWVAPSLKRYLEWSLAGNLPI